MVKCFIPDKEWTNLKQVTRLKGAPYMADPISLKEKQIIALRVVSFSFPDFEWIIIALHPPPRLFMASIGDTMFLHMFTHYANGDIQLTCDDLSWPKLTCKLSETSDFLQVNWRHYLL